MITNCNYENYLWAFFSFRLFLCHKFFKMESWDQNIWTAWWLLLWLANFFGEKKCFPSLLCQPKAQWLSQPIFHRDIPHLCPGPWIHTLHVCIKVLARPSSRQRRESVLGKLTHAGLVPRLTSVPVRRQRGNAAAPSAWRTHAWGSRGEQDRELHWQKDFPTRVGVTVGTAVRHFHDKSHYLFS